MSHEQQARFDARNDQFQQSDYAVVPEDQFRDLVYRPERSSSCCGSASADATTDPERSLMELARQLSSAGKLDRKAIMALSYLDSALHGFNFAASDTGYMRTDLQGNNWTANVDDKAAAYAQQEMTQSPAASPTDQALSSADQVAATQSDMRAGSTQTPTMQDVVNRANELTQPGVAEELVKRGLISAASAKIVLSPEYKQVLSAIQSGQAVDEQTLSAYFPADVQQLIAQSFAQPQRETG